MSRPQRILLAVGVTGAIAFGFAGSATAATAPPVVWVAATEESALRTVARTTVATSKPVTRRPATATTTTAAAPAVWRDTSVNAASIRAAAVAALAARGTARDPIARAELAVAVAVATHTATAAALERAWAAASPARVVAVYTALAQVGTPYRSLGRTPAGFDCSGLTWYAWQAAGVNLPRTSGGQRAGLVSVADLAHALPGDIVWYPGHVELYLGAGKAMVHAKQRGNVVQVEDITKMRAVKAPA